jgi:Fe-S cluster biogenesis protein NfuA
LGTVRPYLQSHGGDVELLEAVGTRVRLRMTGSCQGCPSSEATLRGVVEEAICAAAPDVEEIQVEGLTRETASPTAAKLVPLQLNAALGGSEPGPILNPTDQET